MTTSAEWTGRVGDVWAREWRRTDRSFADLSVALDAAILSVAPERGRAVDLGCGAGGTSLALAGARPGLRVRGVDISDALVAVATERGKASACANLDFAVADVEGQAAAIAADADLLFSRHGVMFYADPLRVFTTLRAAVRPAAALVFSCFRAAHLNPWASTLVASINGSAPIRSSDAAGPFAFADPDRVMTVLDDAGWRSIRAEPVDFRYLAGAGADPVADAVSFFRAIGPVASALNQAAADDRTAMLDNLAATLQDYREGDVVALPAAAWIWTARA